MARKRHVIIPAVYVILEKENQLLLLRRFNTGYRDGEYTFVCGHVEEGEMFIDAAVRETAEEVGVKINPAALTIVHILHRKSRDGGYRMDVFLKAEAWQGEPYNCEPDKCDELTWRFRENLPVNTHDYLFFVLKQMETGVFFGEFGWTL